MWLKHSDGEVKLLAASYLMEVIRILAPQEHYEEVIMKEVVQLIVDSYQHLSNSSSPQFPRRVTILKSFAEIRLCNLMLDMGLYNLIILWFKIY